MSVSVGISPFCDVLDMYGEPDTTSAYSLSGNVSISINPRRSLFERAQRTTRIVVQSITFTFEGQCEVVTPKHGYSASRLCSITRELIGAESFELSNEGHEDDPCHWNAVFNVPIPGWLPPTTNLGYDDEFGAKYFMFAEVNYTVLDTTPSSLGWSLWDLCIPFTSKVKMSSSEKEIQIRRFIPSPSSSSPQTFLAYAHPPSKADDTRFPESISSQLQVFATVPDYIPIDGSSFDVNLQLCAKNLDIGDRQRLRILDFNIDLAQIEKCRSSPSSEYLVRFPIPHESEQPPVVPLRCPHGMGTMFELGLYAGHPADTSNSCSMSLLPAKIAGHYTIDNEDSHLFAQDTSSSNTVYTILASIPFDRHGERSTKCREEEWAGERRLRPSVVMPLYGVRHELQISVRCIYDDDEGGKGVERWLHFAIPIRFGINTPASAHDPLPDTEDHAGSLSADSETATLLDYTAAPSYNRNLPAYSQLFHSNGDRKIDYSTPLPRYTPSAMEYPSPDSEEAQPTTSPIQMPLINPTKLNS